MTDKEFLIELCGREIEARDKWLKAHCELIRAEAEMRCLKASLDAYEKQLQTAQWRESLKAA